MNLKLYIDELGAHINYISILTIHYKMRTLLFASFTLTILLLSIFVNHVCAETCRALILRGGGTKGGYEVGVLKAFLEKLPAEEINYDVVSGVSVGAINGGTFSLFESGQEKEAVDYLEKIWLDMTPDKLFINWSWWIIEGLFR
jgi:predicted acylesterase/phospholipase RssA